MYRILKKDETRSARSLQLSMELCRPCVYERGYCRSYQRSCVHSGSGRDWNPDRAFKYLSPACAPGDQIVKKLGGLHKFMSWNKPILTDSGGFQVFSLASLRKIKEEGVYFNSHVDGRKIFMGPEESMQIQSNLASTIAMAFDECAPALAERDYVERSVARTTRWLARCKAEMKRLNSLPIPSTQTSFCLESTGGGL